jgi:hypothetical protein
MTKFKAFLLLTFFTVAIIFLYPVLLLFIILAPEYFKTILKKTKDAILLLNWLYSIK